MFFPFFYSLNYKFNYFGFPFLYFPSINHWIIWYSIPIILFLIFIITVYIIFLTSSLWILYEELFVFSLVHVIILVSYLSRCIDFTIKTYILILLTVVIGSIYFILLDELIMGEAQRRIGPFNIGGYGIPSSLINGCNLIISHEPLYL